MKPRRSITAFLLLLFFLYNYQLLWFPYAILSIFFGEYELLIEVLGDALRTLLVIGYVYLLVYIVNRRVNSEESKLQVIGDTNGVSNAYTLRILVILALINYIVEMVFNGVESMLGIYAEDIHTPIDGHYIAGLVFSFIWAPIAEEILFRYIFFAIADKIKFSDYDYQIKIGINAALFTLIHYLFLGPGVFKDPSIFFAIGLWTLFSMIAFHVYWRTRNLIAVILLHSFTNISVNLPYIWFNLAKFDSQTLLWIKLLSSAVFLGVIFWIERERIINVMKELAKTIVSPKGGVVGGLYLVTSFVVGIINYYFFQFTLSDFRIGAILFFVILPGYFYGLVYVIRE